MLKFMFSTLGDGNLSQYVTGLFSAINELGHQAAVWNRTQKPVLDAFYEYRPHVLFLDNVWLLDRATVKAVIKYNTKIVVVLDEYNSSELEKFKPLLEQVKDYLIPVVRAEVLDEFKRWGNVIDKAENIAYGLDVLNYEHGIVKESLQCDIAYIGGFDDDKKFNLSKYVLPFTYPVGRFSIKIFGNKTWSVPQFLGYIDSEEVKNLYSSAVTSLYVPQNNHTVHEKFYQILGCGGIPMIPHNEAAQLPVSFIEVGNVYDGNLEVLIEDYKKHPKNREDEIKYNLEFIKQHTYHERAKTLIARING